MYKPLRKYEAFPPAEWIVENFARVRQCKGNVAPEKCDFCERCDLFTDWLHEHDVEENVSALDLRRAGINADIVPNHLGKLICGVCGGFVE
jgi:hypothetical protein